MKKAYIFLANGFEEIEALSPADILRRAGADVTLISIEDGLNVTGARGVCVVCDAMIDDVDLTAADMIILPGGFPGFERLAQCKKVIDTIAFMMENDRYVAAICGAPAAVLGKNGFLKDRRAVCYPGMEQDMNCKRVNNGHVCADGNVITAKAAASALDFSFVLCEKLCGISEANKVRKGLVYDV